MSLANFVGHLILLKINSFVLLVSQFLTPSIGLSISLLENACFGNVTNTKYNLGATQHLRETEILLQTNNKSLLHLSLTGSCQTVIHLLYPADAKCLKRVLFHLPFHLNHDENSRSVTPQRTMHLICLRDNNHDIAEMLRFAYKIPIDVELYFVQLKSGNLALHEVYKAGEVGEYKQIVQSVFEESGKLNLERLLRLAHRRGDLRGAQIKVVAMEDGTHDGALIHSESANGALNFVGGYLLYPLLDLQNMLNFTHVALQAKGWTQFKDEKHMTGMGQQIMNMEADLSISRNFVEVKRAEMLYFLPAIDYEGGYVYYRDGAFLPTSKSMMRPFSTNLWILLGCIWTILWINQIIFANCLGFYRDERYILTREESYSLLFSIVTCRGEFIESGWSSIQIASFSTFLTSFLVLCAYNAEVMVYMFAPAPLIHTVDDLPLHDYITIIDPNKTQFGSSLFQKRADQEKILADSLLYYKDLKDSFYKLLDDNKNFALVASSDYFYSRLKSTVPEQELCSVSSLPNHFAGRVHISMLMRLGSPLRELFTHRTMKINENGLSYRYRILRNNFTGVRCDEPMRQIWKPSTAVTLRHCTVAFSIFLVGAILSPLILHFENKRGRSFKEDDRSKSKP